MPTAPCNVRSVGGGSFTVAFIINDVRHQYLGRLNPAMTRFVSSNATLEFNNIEQLTPKSEFDGLIGPEHFSLTLENGLRLTGPLDSPIHPPTRVSGSWNQTQT